MSLGVATSRQWHRMLQMPGPFKMWREAHSQCAALEKIIEMPDEREVCRAVHQTNVMTLSIIRIVKS